MTKNQKHSPHNLHGWFYYRTVVLSLGKKRSQDFLNKSLVRPNSKSTICQRFQSISYKTSSL